MVKLVAAVVDPAQAVAVATPEPVPLSGPNVMVLAPTETTRMQLVRVVPVGQPDTADNIASPGYTPTVLDTPVITDEPFVIVPVIDFVLAAAASDLNSLLSPTTAPPVGLVSVVKSEYV